MLTFYHSPMSRSASIYWLLEELEVPFEIEVVDIRAEGGAPESYRKIQPHKKVPSIVHDGVVVTERAAIAAYLADAFPAAGLAPPIGDPRRGPYLSWLVYADAVVDPGITARMQGWTYPKLIVSFGAFEDTVRRLDQALSASPYIAGDAFTAADTQIGSAIHYGMNIAKALPELPSFRTYLGRVAERPGFQRFMAKGA